MPIPCIKQRKCIKKNPNESLTQSLQNKPAAYKKKGTQLTITISFEPYQSEKKQICFSSILLEPTHSALQPFRHTLHYPKPAPLKHFCNYPIHAQTHT